MHLATEQHAHVVYRKTPSFARSFPILKVKIHK